MCFSAFTGVPLTITSVTTRQRVSFCGVFRDTAVSTSSGWALLITEQVTWSLTLFASQISLIYCGTGCACRSSNQVVWSLFFLSLFKRQVRTCREYSLYSLRRVPPLCENGLRQYFWAITVDHQWTSEKKTLSQLSSKLLIHLLWKRFHSKFNINTSLSHLYGFQDLLHCIPTWETQTSGSRISLSSWLFKYLILSIWLLSYYTDSTIIDLCIAQDHSDVNVHQVAIVLFYEGKTCTLCTVPCAQKNSKLKSLPEGLNHSVVTRGRSFNSHRTSPCFCIPLWTAPRHAGELFPSRYLPISSSVLRHCRGHIAEPRRRCYDSDYRHVFSRGPRSHFSLLCETNQKLVTPPSPEMASPAPR